ncbi:hypothetical protein EMIT0P12_70002 [Pseudomonas sp. IT-P12]
MTARRSAVECRPIDAGWSSLVARRAHNPKVVGSNPAPATNIKKGHSKEWPFLCTPVLCAKQEIVLIPKLRPALRPIAAFQHLFDPIPH